MQTLLDVKCPFQGLSGVSTNTVIRWDTYVIEMVRLFCINRTIYPVGSSICPNDLHKTKHNKGKMHTLRKHVEKLLGEIRILSNKSK